MKVVQVSALYLPEFRGGATLVCQRLAEGLVALGHQCPVFSGRTTSEEPLGALARDRVGRCETHRVNVGGALWPWSPEAYWNPVASAAFSDFLDRERPDLVHVHSLQGLGVGLLSASRAMGVPVIVTMHDWWWLCPCLFRLSPQGTVCPARVEPAVCSGREGYDFEARRATLGTVIGDVARIVVPSAFLAESLRENGFDANAIVVHENGIPPPAARLPAPGSGQGPARFLYIGGAGNAAKGLEVLLAAVADCREEFVIDAYCVGAAEIAPWEARLGGRVRRHDAFAPEQIDDIIAATDAVVVPSIMRESYSLVTREALARGRPVLTTDCGGPEEVVRDGENGLIVSAGSSAALGQALDRLAGDRAFLCELAAAASLEPTSPQAHAEMTAALYEQVISEQSSSGGSLGPPPELTGRRVLFLSGMDGAPLRYRVWNLARSLARIGVSSEVLYHSDVAAVSAARAADVIVLYRTPFSAMVSEIVRDARRRRAVVVFSSDDLVFAPELSCGAPALEHPDAQVVEGYRQSVDGHARSLRAADCFLGSTPELAQVAQDLGHRAYWVPNGLSKPLAEASTRIRSRREKRQDGNGQVRLGYASGTDTHDADLASIAPAIESVLSQFPLARLSLIGPLSLPECLEPFAGQVERYPLVAWNELPEHLANFDVNLAPLDTTRLFNRAKSEVKWIEASAVEVPTVASDVPAFVRASRGGVSALLCDSILDWTEALQQMVSSPGLRESIAEVAYADVHAHYGPEAQDHQIAGFLQGVLESERRTEELPAVIELEAGGGSRVALEPDWKPLGAHQFAAESGGPLGPHTEVEQRIPCRGDGLFRVDVRVGTYARRNDHDVRLSLLTEQGEVLAEKTLSASHLVDRSFVSVELDEPYKDSGGRGVVFRGSAPAANRGNEILFWHGPSSLGGLRIAGEPQPGRALSFRTFHDGLERGGA